mgnify:CR=1 FL=1
MPKAFQPIPVPKFTLSQLALADLCAREIWNGTSYESGKELEASDEELMHFFASPVFALYKNPNSRRRFTELDIRLLIRSARLKALFQTSNGTDFKQGISAFKATAFQTYKGWKDGTLQLTAEGYATKATLDWSFKFVKNLNTTAATGNHRVPLANRILFFALPDMLVFNFSNGLTKKMQLQSRPQAALPYFNKLLNEGLIRNDALLSKFDMPQPTVLSETIWTAANNGGWWKRRVLDLALLLHFGATSATPSLQTQARQLAAQMKRASKKA